MPSLIRIDLEERHIESQIRVDAVTAYIAKKSALKSAYKRARSVGVMLLVVGGDQSESAQLFKVGRSQLVCSTLRWNMDNEKGVNSSPI